MAMDHSSCDHPRTPAGRAACRKRQVARGSTEVRRTRAAQPDTTTDTPREARERRERLAQRDREEREIMMEDKHAEVNRKLRAHGYTAQADLHAKAAEKAVRGSNPRSGTPTTTVARPDASRLLGRPGAAIQSLEGIPRVFHGPIRWARGRNGWSVRVGHVFVVDEPRVEVQGPRGEVALVWSLSEADSHAAFFRSHQSSVTHRMTIDDAFRLARGASKGEDAFPKG